MEILLVGFGAMRSSGVGVEIRDVRYCCVGSLVLVAWNMVTTKNILKIAIVKIIFNVVLIFDFQTSIGSSNGQRISQPINIHIFFILQFLTNRNENTTEYMESSCLYLVFGYMDGVKRRIV